MSEIINLKIDLLKEHSENTEYFDDIVGENYQELLNSIKIDGVITPVIVSNDLTIISGHQRVRACRDLEIDTIPVIIKSDIETEDDKLRNLLASNIGRLKNDPNKMRKVAVKYVELCGLKHGERQIMRGDYRLSQKEIADKLNISERTLKELLNIERNLAPEFLPLLNNGTITKTTAERVFCKIDKQTQSEIIKEFGADIIKKLTTKETQSLVDDYNSYKQDYDLCKQELQKIKEAKQDLESMKSKYKNYQEKIDKLNQEASEVMATMTKLKKDSENENKKINNQIFIVSKISSAIYPLTQSKGQLEKYFKNDYRLDNHGIKAINTEIEFLCDFIQLLKEFINKGKVEVVNYESINR